MQPISSRASFAKDYAAYKNIQQTDYITRHRILNRLLEMLSNPRIRHRQSGKVLPYILHEKTKTALMSDYGFEHADIAKMEADIFDFAEYHALDYEVVRDVPGALYFDLRQTNKTDLIFTKRAVAIPTSILNALVCEALEKEFARNDILACDGFVLREGYLRLDLDGKLVRRGFITPIADEKSGLIIGLYVFRYPGDERQFVLRSRRENSLFSEVMS